MLTLARVQHHRLALRWVGIGLYWASCVAFGVVFSFVHSSEWLILAPVITGVVGLILVAAAALLYLPNVLAFVLGLIYLAGACLAGGLVAGAIARNALN